MKRLLLAPLAALVLLAGCDDDETVMVPVADTTAPAAPRGLVSVTGDGEVYLNWLANTESDVRGYRVYVADCASGPGCPYDRVGSTTGTAFTVAGLANGVTRYFAVAAFDAANNESALTYVDLNDTPRPEGWDRLLTNHIDGPTTAGYDFSAFAVRPFDDDRTDLFFSSAGGELRMIAPFADTDLQDAGWASSLDAVDYAPTAGWSPTGTAELIVGHCYVVRITPSGGLPNYGKFRVTSVTGGSVVFDWAYQTAINNRELKQVPVRDEGAVRARRPVS